MKRLWLVLAIVLSSKTALATTRICVSVQQRSWYRSTLPAPPVTPAPVAGEPASPSAAPPRKPVDDSLPDGPNRLPALPVTGPAPAKPQDAKPQDAKPQEEKPQQERPPQRKAASNPHAIDPTLYLTRMLEYEITHEPGFAAVTDRCEQRLAIELYQLESGWTVFARYSGTEREEKIDHAELDEFGQLAQRIAFSLLRNRSITQTITRENVLRADSEMNLRTIDGSGHLVFGMGTATRVGRLPTAQGPEQPTATEVRILTPVSLQVGYRRKLRAWGLDAFGRLNLGTENTGIHRNDLGGHVDYTTSVLLGLHFLHYLDAPGVNSFYFGGGAAFELAWFGVIRPVDQRFSDSRDTLLGGGLNLDLLVGYEFLRASSVHFFGQIEIDAPTYVFKTENDSGAINTYMPGAMAQIGIIF